MKRVVFIFLILAVVIGATVATYFFTAPAEPESLAEDPQVEVVSVGRDTLLGTVDAVGQIEPMAEVEMKFEIGGIVEEVLVKRGQAVSAGDILARLNITELETEVERARIDLEQSQAELDQLFEPKLAEAISSAKARVESGRLALIELEKGPDPDAIARAEAALSKQKVALKEAQWAYDQVAYLGDVGAMPQANELQQATLDYESALADYNDAVAGPTEAELAEARATLAANRASLAELLQEPSAAEIGTKQAQVDKARLDLAEKQRNLDKAVLVAPIDGVITEINIEPGERALNEETNAALVLADASAYLLKVEVDEVDIGRVKRGQPVEVSLDAMPDETFNGRVADIAPRPVQASDSTGIVAYEVIISLLEEDPRLLTGMTALATIEVERLEQIVVVPNQAIQMEQNGDQPIVYVEKLDDQDNLMRVEVELGMRNGTVTQIVAGVSEGDRILIRNQEPLPFTPTL